MTYNQVQLFRINHLADQSFTPINIMWVNSLKHICSYNVTHPDYNHIARVNASHAYGSAFSYAKKDI